MSEKEYKIETTVDESVPEFKSRAEERRWLNQQEEKKQRAKLNHIRSEADTSTDMDF